MSLESEQPKTDCQWVKDQLSAYIDGQVPDEDRARIERHLRACEACAADLAEFRLTVDLLHAVPMMAVPRPFTLTAPATAPRTSFSRAFFYLRNATAAVAALLIVMVAGAYVLPQMGPGYSAAPVASTSSQQKEAAQPAAAATTRAAASMAPAAATTSAAAAATTSAPAAPMAAPAAPAAMTSAPAAATTAAASTSAAKTAASTAPGAQASGAAATTAAATTAAATTAPAAPAPAAAQATTVKPSQGTVPAPSTLAAAPTASNAADNAATGATGAANGFGSETTQPPAPTPESVFAHAAPPENAASPASPFTIGIFVVVWLLLMLGAATTTIWLKERKRG